MLVLIVWNIDFLWTSNCARIYQLKNQMIFSCLDHVRNLTNDFARPIWNAQEELNFALLTAITTQKNLYYVEEVPPPSRRLYTLAFHWHTSPNVMTNKVHKTHMKAKHCVESVRIRSYSGQYSVRMLENTN